MDAELSKLPANWNTRPDSMLGESQSSYLTSPRRKMRSSWIGGSDSTKSADDDNEMDLNPLDVPGNSLVMDKLTTLRKQNEQVHSKNESHVVAPRSTKDDDASVASTDTTKSVDSSTERNMEAFHSPSPASKEKVVMQRTDIMSPMTERPSDWMGGEGESVQMSYLQSPKTKLRRSWLKTDDDDGNDDGEKETAKPVVAQRRKTSPGVMKTLSELSQKNEENHASNQSLEVKKKSTSSTESAATTTNITTKNKESESAKKDTVLSPRTAEKIRLQRADIGSMAERPSGWLGGEGESAELSYLRSPKTKLRSSWLQNDKVSQSMRDVTSTMSRDESLRDVTKGSLAQKKKEFLEMNKSMPSMSVLPSQRRSGNLVAEKLNALSKKNQEEHEKNEKLAVHKTGHESSLKKKAASRREGESEKEQNEAKKEENHVKFTPNSEQIVMQRTDAAYLAERPTSWLGGVGEAAALSYFPPPRKTKLRRSWLQTSAKGSQSMRNVYSKAESLTMNSSSDHEAMMHASESNLFTCSRRNTGSAVMEKLRALKAQNDENHRKNEELATVSYH